MVKKQMVSNDGISNMNVLVFKDLIIIKRFIEKGLQQKLLFDDDEKYTVEIIHKKLYNIINEVLEK